MIKLVPVLTLTEDGKRLDKFTTTRSYKKAINKICDYFLEKKIESSYKIYISHALDEVLANEAKKIICEKIKEVEVIINTLSPVFITQGGPSCVSIQYIKKHSVLE